MKHSIGVLCVIGAVMTVLLTGCDPSGSGGTDWDALFTPIARNTTYNRTIASFGTDYFKFTTAGAGSYTISVTNISADGDMGWEVYDDADPFVASYVGGQDVFDDNTSEVGATSSLAGSTTYYLIVDEWADPGSSVTYDLEVSP